MSAPLEALLALLDLEQTGETSFRGVSPATPGIQVYGGQAIAQALVAAQRTVPADRPVHSLHCYFILPGDKRIPIEFDVERIRDGRSFTTRRCVASQKGQAIFSMIASFQIEENGFEHSVEMPEVPAPETLPSSSMIAERFRSFLPQGLGSRLEDESALDLRVVDPEGLILSGKSGRPSDLRQYIWFRTQGALSDDRTTHTALLAYLSDMTLLNTALLGHGRFIFDPTLQVASLDHALWFHRPFRVDEWTLYAQDSPNASAARALSYGRLFSRDGRLIASVAQEGLIRQRG
jgi:acyl-CoA thioesterase-2